MKKISFLTLVVSATIFMMFYSAYQINKANKQNYSSLVLANVEALAVPPEGGMTEEQCNACRAVNGNCDMASVCVASGIYEIKCTKKNEITVLGVVLYGNYKINHVYPIPWARYSCTPSPRNCCIKQGLYSGDTKLA